MKKYIFLTGGVVSSVGKGVTAAALGKLLKERGFRVSIQKLDPYINVDPGTMSPTNTERCMSWMMGLRQISIWVITKGSSIQASTPYVMSPPVKSTRKLSHENDEEIFSAERSR